jgi:hypothetical protein
MKKLKKSMVSSGGLSLVIGHLSMDAGYDSCWIANV